jgi:hypothetical protein
MVPALRDIIYLIVRSEPHSQVWTLTIECICSEIFQFMTFPPMLLSIHVVYNMRQTIFVYLLLFCFCPFSHGKVAKITDQGLALHTEPTSPTIEKDWTGKSLINQIPFESDDHTCAPGRPCKNGACCGARYAQNNWNVMSTNLPSEQWQ